jgi:lipopolysaccharide heptosyltransferase III
VKILVLQLKRIGDVILTTPALYALRRQLPKAHIALAVESGCRELLPAIDFVDETLVYNRQGKNAPLWARMVFEHFDVCLDYTGNDRSAMFAVLSKANRRVAFEWITKSKVRSLFYNTLVDSSVRENHTVDHYLDLLRGLDIEARGTPVTLHLPTWAEKKAEQHLAASQCAGPFVVVHPGTARLEKYWPPERWSSVIDWCVHVLKLPCVLTGSEDAAEREQLERIKARLYATVAPRSPTTIGLPAQTAPAAVAPDEPPVYDLSGRLDLLTVAAITKRARLVLSVDSAPMHLAAAFGTPQVALFGPTNPFHWRPRHERAVVIVAGDPQTNPPFKPHHTAAPMADISTGQVIDAIKSLPVRD